MTSEKTAADAGYGKLGLCSGCHYFPDYLNGRKCTPGDACIRAHSGRQIDRFLRNNPELAQNYLSDIFWERRAIATRYAAVDLILGMKSDPDEVVRRVVAMRLPVDELIGMISDRDREVRLSVAARLPEPQLVRLVNDPDYLIRATVARRLPHGQLAKLAKDPEREVRKVVASRLPPFALHMLADDDEPEVRAIVAERALPGLAAAMLQDSEWWVRLAAVGNAPIEFLRPLPTDPEIEVREAAQARLAESEKA